MRATRHISREQADADSTPGVPGGYGTTSGGQPGARTGVKPGSHDAGQEAGYPDTIAGSEPSPDEGTSAGGTAALPHRRARRDAGRTDRRVRSGAGLPVGPRPTGHDPPWRYWKRTPSSPPAA
ncbi:hypothetical protein ABZV31_26375 [Streptomyces sp. NPDC005202]|uniref:hypothetical protein n=1 Tax=Streptomyces sp. NPDC005202 TaxID=3157021 RepID=UPI0033BD1767